MQRNCSCLMAWHPWQRNMPGEDPPITALPSSFLLIVIGRDFRKRSRLFFINEAQGHLGITSLWHSHE